ncbi:MAG TPA: arginine--tRNA ligase, partial [Chitinophagaceae bacterium]|nr:arginine--tRNA ligase [Chitinophagaceae bacterium]
MALVQQIRQTVLECLSDLYSHQFTEKDFQINQTKPEFEGDYTVVLFSIVKLTKKSPDAIGNELGSKLIESYPGLFTKFNLIKGFLNLTINDEFWIQFLGTSYRVADFGIRKPTGRKVMVEYSSPNTNKPLHLGHLRNNFLGWSVAEIFKANGNAITKTCIVNDRGIHICKSMIAWQKFANGATPESTNMKGDHFVGEYYVKFNDELKRQVDELVATGISKDQAEKDAPIMKETQQMLVDWEAGKTDVMDLWHRMNHWVYEGFDETYKRIGSDFDKIYYESETYILGKKYVDIGLEKGIFYKKDDGSVWIDLTSDGLDEKLLLRKDGTSVYITQDLGLADVKQQEFHADESVYVIADEQNYHMQVLKLICQRLGIPNSNGIHHLSYGMVELPSGKMKSREGTVVDADDLLNEMYSIAEKHTQELGKVKDFEENELKKLYQVISVGALKFFLLRVDPKKRMVFNPEESIDFHGFTGPFIQYTHARIKSVLRKKQPQGTEVGGTLLPLEKQMILLLEQFQSSIEQAASEMNPS